jgi:hypothetical protein
LTAMLAGLGVFLLHNLVDFAMFEVGPMFLFALLAGGALGMRGDHSTPSADRGRATVMAVSTVGVVWLIAAVTLVVPVVLAEERAAAGDEHLRTGSAALAARAYHDARERVPYNAEYAYSEARVGQAGAAVALDAAIAANPLHPGYYFQRGATEASRPQPDVARVRSDYDRALALDPANVERRLDYAKTLERLNLGGEARVQYQRALQYNAQLPPDEMERLPPARVAEIEAAAARLGS